VWRESGGDCFSLHFGGLMLEFFFSFWYKYNMDFFFTFYFLFAPLLLGPLYYCIAQTSGQQEETKVRV
jgi:hypothetical protein